MYSKQRLLKILKGYAKEIGRTPKMKDVAKDENLPPINQFLKNFGSWNNLVKEAGLKINATGEYSEAELIDILRKLSIKLKRSPKIEDLVLDKKLPSHTPFFKIFGSWNNALIEAGLEINKKQNYPNTELIKILKELAIKLNRPPKMSDLKVKKGLPEATIFKYRFGSWNKALEIAGLEVKYQFRKWNKTEIIEWLRKKYEELGRTPGIRDFDNDPKTPGKNTVRKLFGNWTNALREAKIPVKRFRSEKELIEILRKIARKLNRTPTREELKKRKDCPSLTPFVERFGSYTAACLRAGLIPNDGRNNNIWKAWQKHCEDMAKILYGKIETQVKDKVNGRPDIYIPYQNLFIEAKTCGYGDFKEQIKRYCFNGNKLEFWCIFKGLETKRKNILYIYAEELAWKMRDLGEEGLAAKCHQFIRNVYSDEQTILSV